MTHETTRSSGALHLVSAMVQSVALAGAVVLVTVLGQDLPSGVLVIGSLALGLPAVISIHRAWLRFLWDRKLGAARERARHSPDSLDAQYELGVLLATRGRNEAAQQAFDTALSLVPSHAPSLVGHGHVAAQLGDLSQALEYFQRAAAEDQRLFSAQFGMGTIYQAREQYARSISAFERALEIEPDDGPTLAELARCHLALGDTERAAEALGRARAAGYRDTELERSLRELEPG